MSSSGWSSPTTHVTRIVIGVSTIVVLASLNYTWYSPRWPGTYEFYGISEDAFGARGYPVEIAIRVIVLICIVTAILVVVDAAIWLFQREGHWISEGLWRRVLLGLTSSNLVLVLIALTLPPKGMVLFVDLPGNLVWGAWIGLVAATIAAVGALFGLVLPNSTSRRAVV